MYLLLPLLLLAQQLQAWDPADGDIPWQPDEIALFELVDEVNGTFYELMEVARNATSKEIKIRYKELAMVLHPDKNPELNNIAVIVNQAKDTLIN